MTTELPQLEPSLCRGNGECIRICPTECLEMETGRPWLARPADCIACSLCVQVCPTGALTMIELAD